MWIFQDLWIFESSLKPICFSKQFSSPAEFATFVSQCLMVSAVSVKNIAVHRLKRWSEDLRKFEGTAELAIRY